MDKRLEQIKEIFEKKFPVCEDCGENSVVVLGDEDNDGFLEVAGEITFSIDPDGTLAISFYSNCRPPCAGNYIRELYKNGITEFEIYESMFIVFDDDDDETKMLFGEDAENAYFRGIFEDIAEEIHEMQAKRMIPKSKLN